MIGLLRGKIYSIAEDYVIVDINGVGYKVENNAPFRLGLEGNEVELFIHTHVREVELRLFGFKEKVELQLFEKLLNVHGVGPKAAMQIVSTHSVGQILIAIENNDPDLLAVKGVGKKTLAKVILDLKGKLEGIAGKAEGDNPPGQLSISDPNPELAQALESLGFRPSDYDSIAKKIDPNLTFSEQVKQALSLLRQV
jgi:holliday junction DNA helicase RuvA